MMSISEQTQQATRKILESSGTLIDNDHCVYASGDHGAGWVAKDLINLRPELAYQLGQLLGQEVKNNGLQPDIVCGPAIGGVICAQYTALALGSRCVFTERVVNKQGKTINFEIKRGYTEFLKNRCSDCRRHYQHRLPVPDLSSRRRSRRNRLGLGPM